MKNDLRTFGEDYALENYALFENRYSGFGKELYAKLKEENLEIFRNLKFYKRTTYQTEDSFALYINDSNSFAIQLDPLCEVIVLWNKQKQIEIGTWSTNEYLEAINYIKTELIK